MSNLDPKVPLRSDEEQGDTSGFEFDEDCFDPEEDDGPDLCDEGD